MIWERVQGNYLPAQLLFSGISELKCGDWYRSLPPDDSDRVIDELLAWQRPGRQDIFYLFFMQASQADGLMFFASSARYERLALTSKPVTLERDWSSPPLLPGRLVPQPRSLHRQFGGDPVTLHLRGRVQHRRLFIGGTDIQPEERPQVDAVLNLGERPSRWVRSGELPASDRAENKGEGQRGMSMEEIRAEAEWVIARLQKNQSVLVHCAAGMNRSGTICCATLILLEGLSAEQALERVREHHPWARPDSHHWLKLRWLAKDKTPKA